MFVKDPNYLAFVARGLDEVNTQNRRKESRTIGMKAVERRQGKVLDSLSSVLVSRPKGQVIAIGAVPQSDGGLTLVVADNNNVPKSTVSHLKNILLDLGHIRDIRPNPLEEDSLRVTSWMADVVDPDSYEGLLVSLERKILRHSAPKLAQRFEKNDRHANFLAAARDILDDDTQTRDVERTEAASGTLRSLQNRLDSLEVSVVIEAGEITLIDALVAVEDLQGIFKIDVVDMNDADIEDVRVALHSLRGWIKVLEREQVFCGLWNRYTRERRTASNTRYGDVEPDVLRWLTKLTAICDRFEEIASVATSNTLASSFISDNPPNIKVLKKIIVKSTVTLDRNGMYDILDAAGRRPGKSDAGRVDQFLGRLAGAHKVALSADGKLVVDAERPVHCECKVLAELHFRSAIPFIGVSKLSCAFCHLYFAKYRKATGRESCTMGSHDQIITWAFPNLPADASAVNEQVRKVFCKQLLGRILNSWEEYNQPRRLYQSTVASDEGRAKVPETHPVYALRAKRRNNTAQQATTRGDVAR